MRKAIKSAFYSVQRAAGRVTVSLRPAPRWPTTRMPIFVLHTIAPCRSDMAVSQEHLREQLVALQEAGYRCSSFSEALETLSAAETEPSFVLTFDDGYSSVYDRGLPLLESLGMTAILFVTVNFIEGRAAPPWGSRNAALLKQYATSGEHFRPLEWSQLAELLASGRFEIGSHTMNHHLMGRLEPDTLETELRQSKAILENRLGVPVRYFSYPFGVRRYGAYSSISETAVRAAGYEASCTSEIGRAVLGSDPYLLPRIPLVDDDTAIDARAKASGAYDWVGFAQGTFQKIFPNPHEINP